MKKLIIFSTLIFNFFYSNKIFPTDMAASDKKVANYDKTIFEWSKPLSEAFHLIHTKHVNYDANPEKPMIDMIKAFVKGFDAHSYFLDPKGYEGILQSVKGELTGGIGVIINNTKEPDDEFLIILDTIPGGPADKAGIKAQDKIVEIDGEPVKGMTVDEAVAKLKGKRNTKVHVKIIRNDTTRMLPFDITRDIVKETNALCYHFKGHDTYYIYFSMFTENSISQLTNLIQKIQSQKNTKGLIIDLRNNTGGLLDAAIDIASLFLPKGSLVVITKGRHDKEVDRFYTKKEPILNRSIPIFILVNNFTASAAEILPGALQVHADKAKAGATGQHVYIVGNTTYGKGTWQEVIPISNNCAIALTAGVYCLPDGTCVQGKGITPDFTIEHKMPPSQEALWYNTMFGKESANKNYVKPKEETSPRAKDKKETKPETESNWYEKKRDIIASDYSILSTLRLLEMFDLAQKAYPEKMKTRADSIALIKSLYSPEDKAEIEEIVIEK